jgi:putative SOS response-associated peptidase YedK
MCGRFVLATKPSVFVDRFTIAERVKGDENQLLFSDDELDALREQATALDEDFTPNYNIAPRWRIAAISREDDSPLMIARYKWGLLPPWAKDPKMGDRCFNARGETAHEKPMFRSAFKHSRCAVLADGYYEWKKLDAKTKQPYFIHRDDSEPMFFAGLCEPTTETATIITTEAEEAIADIHNRRPVFLNEEEVQEWLDPTATKEELMDVIRTSSIDGIESYPVSRDVNKAGVSDERFIDKVSLSTDVDSEM